jgi:hypothetical protein
MVVNNVDRMYLTKLNLLITSEIKKIIKFELKFLLINLDCQEIIYAVLIFDKLIFKSRNAITKRIDAKLEKIKNKQQKL